MICSLEVPLGLLEPAPPRGAPPHPTAGGLSLPPTSALPGPHLLLCSRDALSLPAPRPSHPSLLAITFPSLLALLELLFSCQSLA